MKNEEFRFTAEHIGSEVLERFSRDIYHPKAIIRELVKNGNDSYWELDQFIDESYVGDIDYNPYQRIVDIVVADQSLIISDYGIGLDRTSIDRLVSIALTDKRKIPGASGFRGIGFWSAYMGGDQLVVESTKLSDSRKYRLTLNTKRMRELQGPNTSIGAIMNLTFPLHH
jgi:HSP90 family molecular chaperone